MSTEYEELSALHTVSVSCTMEKIENGKLKMENLLALGGVKRED